MPDLTTRLAAVLRINGERWRGLATGLDRDLLGRQPEPGEWSALECLGHTVDTEAKVFVARIRALLAGQDLASYDPDAERTPITVATDPVELADRHTALRAESIALLATVTEADLDRTARHAELGVVSLRWLLNEWFAHDTMHLVQAERALMQPFIAGSGAWRSYFADHDVEAKRPDPAGYTSRKPRLICIATRLRYAYHRAMRKHTTMDLDMELVGEAARALGTTRTTDTVHAALAEVVNRRRRLGLLEIDTDLDLAGLDEVRAHRFAERPVAYEADAKT